MMKHLVMFLLMVCFSTSASAESDYAVVVSRATCSADSWSKVVDSLVAKHAGTVLEYDKSVEEVLPSLKKQFPRYTCFVAKPTEATRDFVVQVHQLTRRFDDDLYTDTFWGILTGYDAANALAIARYQKPLIVNKVASGTEFEMEMVTEGFWYDELVKNKHIKKERGAKNARLLKGPDDTTEALVDSLNKYKADLFITSGHATEADWQIGFRYRNGHFVREGPSGRQLKGRAAGPH